MNSSTTHSFPIFHIVIIAANSEDYLASDGKMISK
jgi:hypothetical protein